MNAHDPTLVELRTAKGEPPQAGMGRLFRDDQGAELFEPHRPEHRSSMAIIGVLELKGGRWLARDRGFGIDGPIFPTRDQALRCSIARRIKQFRKFGRQTDGISWPAGAVERMVEWALSVKPERYENVPKCTLGHESGAKTEGIIGQPALSDGDREAQQPPTTSPDSKIADPVIAELTAQNKARKAYPAGHVVHRTLNYDNADNVLSIGTCDCGATFKYPQSQHARMDAAIEAHWQKFDDLPDKVDGRGRAIISSTTNEAAKIIAAPERAAVTVAAVAAVQEPACPSAPNPPVHAGSPIPDIAIPISDDDDFTLEWASYDSFLEDKIITAPLRGIEVARDALHPWLKPHCKDLTVWALRLGCAAIFANFGLHKTAMQLEWCRQLHRHTGKPTLNVLPLGVRHGFIKEAQNELGMDARFVRSNAEVEILSVDGVRHFLTNYESIRDGKLDPNLFGAVSLDEASVLRSYGSKTFQEFLPLFAKVPFKLVATATPSPNRYKELIHYSGFLGVMDTGQALTRFFQRDSEKAGNLTLYPHKEDEFWMWVCSWAAFLQKPSDLGHSDEGYELPPLKVTWHEVPADHSKAEPDRDGQGALFRNAAAGLKEAAASKRDSLPTRIGKMTELIAADPSAHRVLWHDLEAERDAIERALPGVVTITGSLDLDEREKRLIEFEEGRIKYFGTKPILSGSGSNFQYHCHKAIYLGIGYKFNDFIQSLHRLQRFGQAFPVEVDIIYSEDERDIRAELERKWADDRAMRARVSAIIRKYGLNVLPMKDALARSIGCKRVEVKGKKYIAINNDAVAECKTWPDNSIDQIVTSIPFANHYEYSASYNDFGHTDDNAHFWSQMDYLTAELFRMLKPGRLACIHVKDRVLFGNVTGEGVPTISPFHAEAIMHYRAHGFQYTGMIQINTDVVRENNQTYRLGWSECCKDGTKMGVGSPEYVLLLRRPQSNRQKAYADVPVTKSKDDYTRARWQIDAHSFWRSSGNRLLSPDDFAGIAPGELSKLFTSTSLNRIYDYEAHVKIGDSYDRKGALPATFMSIAPGATDEWVWHDVNRMRTLNGAQHAAGREMHLCPLQFDIVDRLIERFSNVGDLIFDPFGGLMTVPYRAILKGRRGAATELSGAYFLDGVRYLQMAEEQIDVPALFDLTAFDVANTPPQELAEVE